MYDEQDETPSVEDQHGDANARIAGNYETAVAAQDDAEAHFAALCCDDDQGTDEFSAYAALRQVYERYGRSRMNAVVRDVDLAILAEHQAETARLAKQVIEALA